MNQEAQVTQQVIAVPPGTTHIAVTVNRVTGEIVHLLHYGEGELHQLFMKIGMALGFHVAPPAPPPAPAEPAAPEAPPAA